MRSRARVSARLAALFLGVALAACGGPPAEEAESGSATADAITTNGVKADLAMQSDWGSGFCAGVTLSNTGSAGVTSWTVVIATNGATLSQLWSGSYTQSGAQITVTPQTWNAAIPPSGSVSFGFCGSGSGRPTLVSLAVNGGSGSSSSSSGGSSSSSSSGGSSSGSGSSSSSGGTCQKGTTRGSEVAVIGESFIAMTHGITQQIEKQARAAGSLAQNDRYVDNSVSGTTLANNQIPSQYTRAVQSSGTIKYVLMDGGGNDCLLNNNGDAAYAAAQQLFQTMAQNRTEKIVYFFYPDPVGSNFASLKSCLDALRPRMKALCEGLTAPRCYWLDLRPLWNGHPEYTSDGIHPTTAGSTVTGDAIWQVMKDNCVAQ